ncbi:hypothetical protein [Rickettsiales endosymbiont of Peranema trichophorum]|uniref:hypothetical protein n=1 Tax=Rickettsiales endosymbiont of Peranema trichophorum TaxID=2486577 RepID=UPI0010237C0E|nr:hypothetical protein [Rickettsiales endosymbiont of Peranema trichophorum]
MPRHQHHCFQHNLLDSQLHLIVQQLNKKFGHHTLCYANDLQHKSHPSDTKLHDTLQRLNTTSQKIDQQLSQLLNSDTPNTSKILKLKKQQAKLKNLTRILKKRAEIVAEHRKIHAATP